MGSKAQNRGSPKMSDWVHVKMARARDRKEGPIVEKGRKIMQKWAVRKHGMFMLHWGVPELKWDDRA